MACLLRGKPQAGEVSSYNCSSGEAARLNRLSVIRLDQWTAGYVPSVVSRGSKRWCQMRQHEILRPHPLCHRAKISRHALAIKDGRRKSAALVGAQDRMHCGVHDDISSLCQLLHLIGGGTRTWRCGHVVAGIITNHGSELPLRTLLHSARWRIRRGYHRRQCRQAAWRVSPM